jgi:hypothetical protein
MSTLTEQAVVSVTNRKKVTITPDQYGLLAILPKNRPIKAPHGLQMKMSVMRNGVLRDVIVVWDNKKNKYYIVDGQHLVYALKELNLPIDCLVVECENEEQITKLMIDLNNTSKSWKLTDYIHGWAESGNKHYRLLKNSINLTYADVQASVIIQAYTMQGRAKATKMVKEGKFEIVNKVKGDELIDCVSECAEIVPNTRPMNEALIKLMLNTEGYNHKHMIKRLKAVVKTFIFSTSEGKLYEQLVSIYNG